MNSYNDEFYRYNLLSSGKSAELIYPIIQSAFSPKSVIDFGCGRGTWLNEALKHGATDAVGLDGEWNANKQINKEIKFMELGDHENIIGNHYDIAISLEVFEHLNPQLCDNLIDTMTSCTDIIIFSAAFVNQRGTDHINEQYPSFWARKFRAKGFHACDTFRPLIWGNSSVDYCYQQNMFVYVNEKSKKFEQYLNTHRIENHLFMDCMHPEIYLKRSGRDAIQDFLQNMKRVVRKHASK